MGRRDRRSDRSTDGRQSYADELERAKSVRGVIIVEWDPCHSRIGFRCMIELQMLDILFSSASAQATTNAETSTANGWHSSVHNFFFASYCWRFNSGPLNMKGKALVLDASESEVPILPRTLILRLRFRPMAQMIMIISIRSTKITGFCLLSNFVSCESNIESKHQNFLYN